MINLRQLSCDILRLLWFSQFLRIQTKVLTNSTEEAKFMSKAEAEPEPQNHIKVHVQLWPPSGNGCIPCDSCPPPTSYAKGIIFVKLLVIMMFGWRASGAVSLVSAHFAVTWSQAHTQCIVFVTPTVILCETPSSPLSLLLSLSAFAHCISKGFSRPWQQGPFSTFSPSSLIIRIQTFSPKVMFLIPSRRAISKHPSVLFLLFSDRRERPLICYVRVWVCLCVCACTDPSLTPGFMSGSPR